MAKNFTALVADLRELDFFEEQSLQDLREAAERVWGLELPEEANNQVEAEVMLATLDSQRVCHVGSKTCGENGVYSKLLADLSNLSRGRFEPSQIEESESEVSFFAHSYQYRFQPNSGHYLDMKILRTVNAAVFGKNTF